jgi:hypothetical protein
VHELRLDTSKGRSLDKAACEGSEPPRFQGEEDGRRSPAGTRDKETAGETIGDQPAQFDVPHLRRFWSGRTSPRV